MALFEKTGYYTFQCSVVGVVSASDLYMENHGDFKPNIDHTAGSTTAFGDAAFRFSLTKPEGPSYVAFSQDFTRAVQRLKVLVDMLPHAEGRVTPFIEETTAGVTLRFTRKVFQRIVSCTIPFVIFLFPFLLHWWFAFQIGNNSRQSMWRIVRSLHDMMFISLFISSFTCFYKITSSDQFFCETMLSSKKWGISYTLSAGRIRREVWESGTEQANWLKTDVGTVSWKTVSHRYTLLYTINPGRVWASISLALLYMHEHYYSFFRFIFQLPRLEFTTSMPFF